MEHQSNAYQGNEHRVVVHSAPDHLVHYFAHAVSCCARVSDDISFSTREVVLSDDHLTDINSRAKQKPRDSQR